MNKNEFDEEELNRWEKLAKEAADEFDRMALLEEPAEEPCRCGAVGEELHTCPYAEDIGGDSESLCNCCADCQYQCAMDI